MTEIKIDLNDVMELAKAAAGFAYEKKRQRNYGFGFER